MARDLTGKNVKADAERATLETQRSNSAWRKSAINDACRQLLGIDEDIKKLQAEKSEIKNKVIKGDLGMKAADFAVAMRYYKLEDPDDRAAFLDTIRECFLALGIGEQGDFFSMMDDTEHGDGGEDEEGDEAAEPEEADPVDLADMPKSYQKGYSAGEAGKNLDTNNYKVGSKLHDQFIEGWNDAQAEKVRQLGGDDKATHQGPRIVQ